MILIPDSLSSTVFVTDWHAATAARLRHSMVLCRGKGGRGGLLVYPLPGPFPQEQDRALIHSRVWCGNPILLCVGGWGQGEGCDTTIGEQHYRLCACHTVGAAAGRQAARVTARTPQCQATGLTARAPQCQMYSAGREFDTFTCMATN